MSDTLFEDLVMLKVTSLSVASTNTYDRHLSSNADCFFGTASKLIFFPDHFLPNCFRFIVLYTVYSSGLAVLYLSHSK